MKGRPANVFVLNDYDPAGVSLAEDITAKLEKFAYPLPVTVRRIALNGEQVRAWDCLHPDSKGLMRVPRGSGGSTDMSRAS